MEANEKDAISWYQKKIRTFDQQILEQSLEQSQLKGFKNKARKIGHIKPDFMDIDLTGIRDQPEIPWMSVTLKGILNVVCFPLFSEWWIQVTSLRIFFWLLLLYFTQLAVIGLYLLSPVMSLSEVMAPVCLMLLMGTVHSQIVYTQTAADPLGRVIIPRGQLGQLTEGQDGSSESKSRPCFGKAGGVESSDSASVPGAETRERLFNSSPATRMGVPENVPGCPSLGTKQKHSQPEVRMWPAKEKMNNSDEGKNKETYRLLGKGFSDEISSEDYCEDPPEKERSIEGASGDSDFEVKKEKPWVSSKHVSSTQVKKPSPARRCHAVGDSETLTESELESASLTREILRDGSARFRSGSLKNLKTTTLDTDPEDVMWDELLQNQSSSSTRDSKEASVKTLCPSTKQELQSDVQQNSVFCHQNSKNSSSELVNAIIWEDRECKKVTLSVLELSAIIKRRVNAYQQGKNYWILGNLLTLGLAFFPFLHRLFREKNPYQLLSISAEELLSLFCGAPTSGSVIILATVNFFQRFCLIWIFFFMMCVAERTYQQRFLFAKLFNHITSARKAKKHEIPHFRLRKVENIKIWLALHSYLKRQSPQQSIDVVVSSVYLLTLSIAFVCCAQILQNHKTFLDQTYNCEFLIWETVLLLFLLHLASLGSETSKKNRNISVLLMEQINLYFKMEKKPHKKDQLILVNNMLKLSTKLLKELNTPPRLYGLTTHPLISNITQTVILLAVPGIVSNLLGFNIHM
ncbi:protein PHTF1-like [Monodelphis domestica]|uniref:protein PHTF1-like n=1 Tax=Monodelphis domestica TaxID=13616 RepID=UPI0024E23F16|nr:protein PHTF1-like [Monodelphis domestica]